MKIGDLVKMKPCVAPPELYGVGLIIRITGDRCHIRWSKSPDKPTGSCARWGLEVINANR